MLHFRDDYARADVAKRREFERLHKSAPIRPMNDVRTTPAWLWAACGVVLGVLVVWGIC